MVLQSESPKLMKKELQWNQAKCSSDGTRTGFST